tara:strand:+ start:275 stop:1207 length:933 start_codon:yes stop_codon:yes gene_type:complete
MTVKSAQVAQLYTDLVADLVPYFMNATLLPNSALIRNSINMVGETGKVVRFPVTNAYTNAVTVADGASIIGTANAESEFIPTNVDVTLTKKGIGSDVTLEALSDGGYDLVYRSTLQRLGGGLAQATDKEGFLTAGTAFTTEVGAASTAATSTHNLIMSPDALGYAVKDDGPLVETWYNVDTQTHEFRGTIRDGYAAIQPLFGVRMTGLNTVGTSFGTDAGEIGFDISSVAKATSLLRKQNAPTLDNGNYIAALDAAAEFAINQQVALAGGTAAVGSLSDIGNKAFYDGLVGQAVGCAFFRSNNLPLGSET